MLLLALSEASGDSDLHRVANSQRGWLDDVLKRDKALEDEGKIGEMHFAEVGMATLHASACYRATALNPDRLSNAASNLVPTEGLA